MKPLMFKFLYDTEGGGSGDGDLDVSLNADDAADDLSDNKDDDKSDDSLLDTKDDDDSKDDLDDTKDGNDDDSKDDDNDEEDEEDLEEDTEEDNDEEDDELKDSSVNRKAIEKQFPELFKKFPELRAAIYRDKEFSEVFPTIEVAKDAAEKASILDAVNSDLMEGNVETILTGLHKNSKESFEELSHNFLSTLEKLDEKTYVDVVKAPLKQFLRWANIEGKKHGNKNLVNASILLHRAVFENDDLAKDIEPRKKADLDPEREKLVKERNEFEKGKYQSAFNEVSSRVERRMDKFIREKIDPQLGDWRINKIVKDVINEVYSIAGKDKRLQGQISEFWSKARKEGYNDESKARIISAFLARAKAIIPSIRKDVVLKAMGKKNSSGKKVIRPASGTTMVTKGKGISVKEAKEKGLSDEKLLGL